MTCLYVNNVMHIAVRQTHGPKGNSHLVALSNDALHGTGWQRCDNETATVRLWLEVHKCMDCVNACCNAGSPPSLLCSIRGSLQFARCTATVAAANERSTFETSCHVVWYAVEVFWRENWAKRFAVTFSWRSWSTFTCSTYAKIIIQRVNTVTSSYNLRRN